MLQTLSRPVFLLLVPASLLLLLMGCEQLVSNEPTVQAPKHSWALVETTALQRELNDLANLQNPLPEEYATDARDLSSKQSALKQQISELSASNRAVCLTEKGKELLQKNSRLIPTRMSSSGRLGYYDPECLVTLPKDQLVEDLEAKLAAVEKEQTIQKRHNAKVLAAARKALPDLVSSFAGDDYEVVLGSNSTILHSSTGVTINITQAVSDFLRNNPPKIEP